MTMNEQQTFVGLAWTQEKKATRRERFLAEMDRVIPWTALQALIPPHSPAAVRYSMPPRRS
jgi:transposase, IS5 family